MTQTARITCPVEPGDSRTPLPRRDDVPTLVHRAAAGEERAWTLLVQRFDATIRSVARGYRLNDADRDEVAQRTWLALVRHIAQVRDQAALAGWLVTTARRECLKVLGASERTLPIDDTVVEASATDEPLEERLLAQERHDALHRALADVPEHQRRLMRLLLNEADYDEVSATLGIPKGSIGPTRGRCIARLRQHSALADVVNAARSRPLPGHDLN
jgi:RNA polymerase sigma factor (sigma-70 family)